MRLDCARGDTTWLSVGSSPNNYRSIAWPAFSGKILATAAVGGFNGFVRYKIDPETGASRTVADLRDSSADRRFRGRPNFEYLIATEFSPDGKYYFYEGKYVNAYRLGLVKDGRTVQVKFPEYVEIPNLYLVGWGGTEDRVLLYACTVQAFRCQVWEIDCASGAVRLLWHPADDVAWPVGVVDRTVYWAQRVNPEKYRLLTVEKEN